MQDRPASDWLEGVRSSAAGWIGSADAKATALLSATAIFCGFIGQSAVFAPNSSVPTGLLLVFLTSLTVNLVSLLAVLWPRTNRPSLGGPPRERSLLYFGDIAKMSYENFSGENPAPEEFDRILKDQAYVLCKIATRKMKAFRVAVLSVPLCLGSFIALTLSVTVQQTP